MPRKPLFELTTIQGIWLFAEWGIDLVSPFPLALEKNRFLVIVINYFTKWVKAKPLISVTRKSMLKFVRKNIIFQFKIPQRIISDNGKQFAVDPIKS